MCRSLLRLLPLSLTAPLLAQVSPPPTLALLKDLHTADAGVGSQPTPSRTDPGQGQSPRQQFVRFGSSVVFVADHEDFGRELWITDGAAASWPGGTTQLLKDTRPGPASGDPANLFVHAGYLWFTASDGTYSGLWRSDGTSAGTFRWNGSAPALSVAGGHFAPLSATRFVYSGTPVGGGNQTLWLWDNGSETPLTTQANYCRPEECTALPAGVVFRNARTSRLGFSDGSQVVNLSGAAGPVAPRSFVQVGSRVVFVARNNPNTTGDELWSTDGTAGNTFTLGDLRPGTLSGTNLDVACVHQGYVYFLGHDVAAGSATMQLWRTDGTPGNTLQLTSAAWAANLPHITALASDGTRLLVGTTSALWHVDIAAPAMLQLGTFSSVSQLHFAAGQFWFRQASGTYDELCVSNGSPAGTFALGAAGPGGHGLQACSGMVEIAPNAVLLAGNDGVVGTEVWRSNGTLLGTELVADLKGRGWTQPSSPDGYCELRPGQVFFSADDGVHGKEPWFTDGTAGGTAMLLDLEPGPGLSYPQYAVRLGDVILFSAYTTSHHRELWRTDGTVAGTYLVRDIAPGSLGSEPRHLTRVGGEVFFSADDGVNGRELWATDGTPAGTRLVYDLVGGQLNPSDLCELGSTGRCLFRGTYLGDQELWSSDGTTTAPLLDLNPAGSGSPTGLTRFGNRILFAADDGVHGIEPWITDGTPAGTWLVEDVYPGAASSEPAWFTADDFGNAAYAATNPTYGREIWATDGTAPPLGNRLAIDLVQGVGSGNPEGLAWFGGRHLLFLRDDGTTGREPWIARDGSPFHTQRLADLFPGAGDGMAAPGAAIVPGLPFVDTLGRAYFTANDRNHGLEPWTASIGAWAHSVGRSCSTTGHQPRLAARAPVLGQMWVIEGDDPAAAYAAVALSLPVQLPNGIAAGCEDYLHGLVLWLFPWFLSTAPDWTQTVNLPNDANLIGLRASLQAIYSNGTQIDGRSNGVWLQVGY